MIGNISKCNYKSMREDEPKSVLTSFNNKYSAKSREEEGGEAKDSSPHVLLRLL